MISWFMMNFQNSNSYNMMLLNKLNNFIMMIMLMIMMFIIYMNIFIMLNKFNNKKLIENIKIEIIWTFVPLLIILFFSFPSIKILYLNNEMKFNIITVKIISNQWFWYYEYLNFNNKFNSYMMMKTNFNFNIIETDNSMVIPFNYPIQLILTSMDVIHSWTIPSMNIKIDCIPNQLNNFNMKSNKPNLIYGQCSEICGINHSFMPIKIESINLKNFIMWLK